MAQKPVDNCAPTTEWTCLGCGKQCRRKPTKGRRPKWCSENCRSRAKDSLRKRRGLCVVCGERYEGFGSEICSRSCAASYGNSLRAKPKPKSQPVDLRSDIRRACESRDLDELRRALKDRSNRQGECWVWAGALKQGYPVMKVQGLILHRAIVEATYGAALGTQPVHHLCANRACVNPDHLVPVTHAQNIAEMLARNAYVARIRELEAELSTFAPHHPLLNVIEVA